MSISETLALYEKAQKDYFIANSLIDSCRKSIKGKIKEIIDEKYNEKTIEIKGSVLGYQFCLISSIGMWASYDYRKSKVTIDILFTADGSKENQKILNKVHDDFMNEKSIKADESLAKEFRYRLPLIDVLEDNFLFKF